jgi:hypothetical protein
VVATERPRVVPPPCLMIKRLFHVVADSTTKCTAV